MAALVDERETGSRLGRRFDDGGRAGRNKRRTEPGDYERESIERRRLVFLGTLDFPSAGDIHVIVMVRTEVRVDERRAGAVIVRVVVPVNVLKRRQNEGGHECQTACER
jgi:hypothetical protein